MTEAPRYGSFVNVLRFALIVKQADHEGFHHSPFDWWIFDARETSPKTCPVCLGLHLMQYRGDRVLVLFPRHTHMAINAIRAWVHPHCRCVLRFAGREEEVRDSPLGLLSPEEAKEIWYPSPKELERLSPSQFALIRKFLRDPWAPREYLRLGYLFEKKD